MHTSALRAFALTIPFAVAGQAVLAQTANPALDEAKRRLACGAGVPIAASYLPDGSLQVTCQAPGAEAVAQAGTASLPETGLSAGATAAAVTGALFLVVVANDDDGSGTTTTTTTTGTSD
ncbi:hypothetical protein RA19_22065 [Leisingera sp. ANG-M1]|uniref:hypothetical protein n=1 Tax=Leisingera sp. ANG-M1 TaxID=1577895 RepID=UPI00057C9316|nr:hypothetical protein [Leisingera sp. ANG-M1]KIC07813.1 hypothetical protein RA19_22065 [Leisingera sp. ANG-M1]